MRTALALSVALVLLAGPARAGDGDDIVRWLTSYDRALVAKDLDRLAGFYHPDVTIFEGGGVNRGWADYRDHHLGPELAELEGFEFSHSDVKPYVLGPDGRTAYVTSEYRLKARVKEREIDASGLETLVLLKGDAGAWRIRHSHTSSQRRPPALSPPQ